MMEISVKKRGAYPTADQKRMLIELVNEDEELKRGKFSTSFTKKNASARWTIIAEKLNALVGAKKSPAEWRKTYQDKKALTKKKAAAIRRSANLTGGGLPPPPLEKEEEYLLQTISNAALVGHTDSQESEVMFIDDSEDTNKNQGDVSKEFHNNILQSNEDIVILEEGVQQSNQYDVNGQNTTNILEDKTNTATNEADAAGLTKNKKNMPTKGKKRLQESLSVAKTISKLLEEKNEAEKKFYATMVTTMASINSNLITLNKTLEIISNKLT
ncbi:hypothetical protein evm_001250 [Chilo suppressalis]|nr:hypothetical protein evm_001250 [Chilo suppressalis]